MGDIRLTGEILTYIPVFENVTKAKVKDCIEVEDRLIFIVDEGDIGLAIGKGGSHIRRIHDLLKKNIEVIEYAKDLESFVRKVFHNFRVQGYELDTRDNRKVVKVTVPPAEKGKAIGRQGKNLGTMRSIIKRYHEIDDVVIA